MTKLKEKNSIPKCKTDPNAPHGFLRNASHTLGRYVCECEYWDSDQAKHQEELNKFAEDSVWDGEGP